MTEPETTTAYIKQRIDDLTVRDLLNFTRVDARLLWIEKHILTDVPAELKPRITQSLRNHADYAQLLIEAAISDIAEHV